MVDSIDTIVKTDMDPAGIWNEVVKCLFIVLACCKENVPCCAYAVISRIPEAQIGPIRITDLSSSTRWTVFSLQRFGDFGLSSSVTIAALSRNLHQLYNRVFKCE